MDVVYYQQGQTKPHKNTVRGEKKEMEKWYANITLESGKQITIGEYSEEDLQQSIIKAQKQGIDLSKACVNISKVHISDENGVER